MHILWINEHADFTGGCEKYCALTADFLADKGHRNTILYNAAAPASADFLSHFHRAFPLYNVTQQIADSSPDIIYIHRLDSLSVLNACTHSHIPAVRFFHDHRLFCLREHKYTTIRHKPCASPAGVRCYPCLGWLNKGAHGIRIRTLHSLRKELNAQRNLSASIVGSHYMAKHIAAHGIESSKVHTIPPFAPLPGEYNNEPVASRDDSLVLFVGQLVRGKGIDILIKALKYITVPCHLALIGTGTQENMFKSLSAHLGVENKISFVGSCSSDKLKEYYQKARCIVLPSRAETFGLVGPESMRYGIPAVASDVGGISEWLTHEKTGILVPPCNPSALAKALTTLLTHDARAENYGNAARKDYYKRFTPDVHCTRLLELFNSLLAEHVS